MIYPEQTTDIQSLKLFTKSDFKYDKLTSPEVIFNFGGTINSKNNLLLGSKNSYFSTTGKYPFQFSPVNQWSSIDTASVFGAMVFEEGNFFKIAVEGNFLFEYENILPIFNVSELYLAWKYPLGNIVIGRTDYSLNSKLNFSGTLDGISLEIFVPFLNFKSFLGFTGFTGLFHPWNNDFNISAYDKSFNEQTNLTNLVMVAQLNGNQSRRIFLSTDFDLHYMFFHANPYFLMQYDISNISLPNFNNSDYTINTFTVGFLNKIRIASPLYLYFDISGVFGTMQDIKNSQNIPITAYGFQAELRYTFTPTGKSSLSLCYASGSGTENEENSDFYDFRTTTKKIGKNIYYGNFEGGFVLEPILANIHSLGVKFNSKISKTISGYIHFYQTLKMYKTSPVSDPLSDINEQNMGSEIDAGLLFNLTSNFSLGMDSGLFIPENAYSDKTLRFKFGLSLAVTF